MLDSMRGLAKSFVAKALMLFLVLSFALWGVGDIVRSQGNSSLITVGDESIGPQEFLNEQRNMQQAMEAAGVKGIDPRALQGEILRRMVQQKLVEQWQRDSGIMVDRETLASAIREDINFRDMSNKFDPKLFGQFLQSRGLSETGYLNSLKMELGGKMMLTSTDLSDLTPPANLLEFAATAGTQTRDAVLFTVPPVTAPNVLDAAMQKYYEQHTDQFEEPERRTIEYAVIDMKGKDENAKHELGIAIEDALAGGATMKEALVEAKVNAQPQVLKDVRADQYKDGVLAAVTQQGFTLDDGESSGLLTTPDGKYFVLTVTSVTEAAPKPFEAVKNEVRQAVAKEAARTATRDRVSTLKTSLKEGKDWREAAREAGAITRQVTRVSRPIADATGKVKVNASVPPLLQQAIFEHPVGGVAGPMVQDNGSQTIALVTKINQEAGAVNEGKLKTAEADYRAQLERSMAESVFRSLAMRYPVSINEPMMRQLTNDTPNE